MKCLEKDRTRRYETANGLAMDLHRHLNQEPVRARPPSRFYEFQKSLRRHWVGFSATAAIFLVLAAGVLVSVLATIRAQRAERAQIRLRVQAQGDEKKAKTEAAKSRQVAQFLQDMLKGVGPSKALGRDTTMLREILDQTADRVGKQLTNQPDVEVEMRLTLADTYDDLGLYQKEEQMARETLRLARLMPRGDNDEKVARALECMGRALHRVGNFAEAEKVIREELAMQMKRLGDENPAVATSLNNLANELQGEGRLTEAERLFREALAMQRKLLGNEHPDVASSLSDLANVLYAEGQLAEAEDMDREALKIQKKLWGNEHPAVADALENLGTVLQKRGKLAEAEALLRQALAMDKRLRDNEHPEVATALSNLANLLREERKLTEAEALFREALAVYRKQLGNEHPKVAMALCYLASVLREERKFTQAETLFREALAMYRKLLGNEHPEVAAMLNNLGAVLQMRGKLVEAEAVAREVLALDRKLKGDKHPSLAIDFQNLAFVLQRRGKLTEAEASYREALAMYRKLLGNEHPRVGTSLNQLANVQARLGKWKEAAEDFASLIENGRTNHLYFHSLAALLAASGNLEEYRRCCQEIVARFGDTTDPFISDRMAKDCSILPSSVTDPGAVGRMAEAAAATSSTNRHFAYFQCSAGMAEYRGGHFSNAIAYEAKTIALGERPAGYKWVPSLFVEAYAVSAMAHFRLKQTDEARAALAQATLRAALLPRLGSGDLGDGWLDWIVAHQLLDEASRLIVDSSKIKVEQMVNDLVSKTPDSTNLLNLRAEYWVRNGRWNEAAADYARLVQLEPANHWYYHSLAPLLAAGGDFAKYRNCCEEIVVRFGNTTNPVVAERMAKDCLILSDSGADSAAVGRFADTAVTQGAHSRDLPWFQLAKGLLDYRQGHFASAVEWTDKALSEAGIDYERDVQADMVLAMAQAQLKQGDKARATFARGAEIERTRLPRREAVGGRWSDWIISHALMREAETLIEGNSVTNAPPQ